VDQGLSPVPALDPWGVREVILEALNESHAGQASVQMIDSTIVRAHQHSAGANTGDSLQALRTTISAFLVVASRPRSTSVRTGSGSRRPRPDTRRSFRRQGLRLGDASARAGAECADRRQGLRQRYHPRRPAGARGRAGHPDEAQPPCAAPRGWLLLRPAQPHRTLLQPPQERPPDRDTLRQDVSKLSRVRTDRRNPDLDQYFINTA
jgi:hypothetical protein